jgi:hypothetical protein
VGADRPPPALDAFARMRPVADAVLYEGYLLYPYRRSSPKNRVRWQFGVLAPRAWAERNGPVAPGVAGSAESWRQRTECLAEAGDGAVVHVRVRHLHLQRRSVERHDGGGRYAPVASLEAGGALHLAFDEAVERETDLVVPLADLCAGGRTFPLPAPGGEQTEPLPGGAGRLVRRRHPLEATATLAAERLDTGRLETGRLDTAAPLYRLRVTVRNTGRTVTAATPREEALGHALIATHTFLGGAGLSFCSLTDPPAWAEPYARECRNLHTFPVLAGEPGSRETMLSAPIILPDHPRIAPESPGDLYDAAEIDEILSLRTMLLTDAEKREARGTDARAARILDRVETMPREVLAGLHGTLRPPDPTPPTPAAGPPRRSVPWWQEGGDDGLSPATDTVLIQGVPVAGGSRVRLRPRPHGADAHDMFLAGRSADVAAVLHDVDGSVHLAVTVHDDPAAELHGWYGRFLHFRPDEVEPLTAGDGTAGPADAAGPPRDDHRRAEQLQGRPRT